MSLAAVPAYALARRLVSQPLALLAALLAVAVPSLVYTGVLMTENAFYPLFLLCVWLLVLALERPSPALQIAVLAAAFVAFLTRAQAVALVPAIALAPPLYVRAPRAGRPPSPGGSRGRPPSPPAGDASRGARSRAGRSSTR